MNTRGRITKIRRALDQAYPGARTALKWGTPFELLVATILSAQCTDDKVNEVTPVLFGRFPSPRDLACADPEEVERIVRPTGLHRQKTKAIVGSAKVVVDRFGGEVPRTMDELVSLPGVGRKTANVVMANCWPGHGHGIFVDTHVARVSRRLALTESTRPDRIERDLMELVPKRDWADFGHQLIELGRGPCDARRPDHAACPLLRWCPTGISAAGSGSVRTRRAAVGGSRPGATRRPSR